jgi:hypothetical protein
MGYMAGMDPKILAAVFASVAALAIGTGGTSVDNLQNANPQDVIGNLLSSTPSILNDMSERPEPDNSVKISIEVNSEQTRIDLRKAEVMVEDFNELESDKRTISSDESISFPGFNGLVEIEDDNRTLVKGRSNGFRSSGVNYTGKLDLEIMTDSDLIRADDVEKTAFDFSNVDVRMASKTDDTVIQKGNSSMKIDSFSGDVSIFPGNMSLVLDGKVAKFKAGGTSFTG